MNSFYNLVPPDMDSICVTQNNYSATTTSQILNSTTTCSVPLDYYKGYAFDVLFIVLAVVLILRIFIWNK